MFRHRIDQKHSIAEGREPASISSRASAGIDDGGWRRRQVAENQFLRSSLFELKPSCAKPGRLFGVAVMTNDLADDIIVAHAENRLKAETAKRRLAGAGRDSPTAWRYVAPHLSRLPQCAASFAR
jgi:hypothetical protein